MDRAASPRPRARLPQALSAARMCARSTSSGPPRRTSPTHQCADQFASGTRSSSPADRITERSTNSAARMFLARCRPAPPRRRRHPRHLPVHPPRRLAHEMAHEHRDNLGRCAAGTDRKHVQAIVRSARKRFIDHLFQIDSSPRRPRAVAVCAAADTRTRAPAGTRAASAAARAALRRRRERWCRGWRA